LRVAECEFPAIAVNTTIRKNTMVNAVSSQAATLNLVAHTALEGDDRSIQPASNAKPDDGDRGPATQVSLSQDALDRVKSESLDVQAKANEARAGILNWLNESYSKLQNATPVPAVQLTKEQVADVLKKAAPLGIDPSKIGSADNYIFGIDGMQYTFKKDGTAWVNEAGVPTSEKQKQYALQEMSKSMAYLYTKIQDTIPV
jgi:hypothetical protein